MKPKKYIICGFLTWSQNRWFMEIDMYAVADKKMLFIFSWTVILQLQGFITITLDKCVHDSTALLIHHTHFYTDFFSCKHWFSNSTEPKLCWLTSNSSVLIDQFNCLIHLSSRNTSNVSLLYKLNNFGFMFVLRHFFVLGLFSAFDRELIDWILIQLH